MSLPALEEEEEQEEEEELDLGGPVVGDLPATLFTCLLRGWANVALTLLQLIHVGVEVLVGLCLLELIAQGRGFKLHHVNLRMRHKLPVLPVRIQETTGVATRVVGPPPQALLARVCTQHVITLHAEWLVDCRHLASGGGGLEEHGGEFLFLRRPPRFEVELRA